MNNETTTEQRVYSEDELRGAVNSATPMDALEIALSLLQRSTLALESIARSMEETPTVLFEQTPSSEGVTLDPRRRDDDTEN